VLHLLVFEGPQLSGSLAQALGVTPSTVTGLCDRLLERGLVRREEDSTDRRCTRVFATDKGHTLVTEHFSSTREQLRRILENLSTSQRAVVGQALEALLSAATPGSQ
jgi:DNA-binding MarR family transcriptional regulator